MRLFNILMRIAVVVVVAIFVESEHNYIHADTYMRMWPRQWYMTMCVLRVGGVNMEGNELFLFRLYGRWFYGCLC